MIGRSVTAVTCLLMTLLVTSSAVQQDKTREEDAGGTDIVNAVVDMIRQECIFNDDRLFLRRVAYVETLDGTDPSTYTQNYHGGIWKVDQSMFAKTQPCPSILSTECKAITDSLSIDWAQVTWTDLRKPLYSGLAAALYMMRELKSRNEKMPGAVNDQASLWARLYRSNGNANLFQSRSVNATSYQCSGAMDVAFVLDASGSVGSSNFNLMLQFVAAVTDALTIGTNEARVAQVVYSSSANVSFYLNRYTSSSALRTKIMSTPYTGGLTYTGRALDLTRTNVFSASNGARSSARQVVVLLTDGRSNSYSQTVTAATNLKTQRGVVLFTIGIGGYSLQELNACATTPVCSHVFTLDNFSFIQSIVYEIQKVTCEARIILDNNGTTGGAIPGDGLETDIETEKPDGDEHIEVEVECGEVDTYVAYNHPNPGPAFYDEHHQAFHRRPSRIYLANLHASQTVYLRLSARRVSDEEALRLNCTDYNYTVSTKPDPATTQAPVATTASPIYNPCTPHNIALRLFYHPHPLHPNMFIQCDEWGGKFEMKCPPGLIWKQSILTCHWP